MSDYTIPPGTNDCATPTVSVGAPFTVSSGSLHIGDSQPREIFEMCLGKCAIIGCKLCAAGAPHPHNADSAAQNLKATAPALEPYVSENVTKPNQRVVTNVLRYLAMCSTEYEKGMEASATLAELQAENENLKQQIQKALAELLKKDSELSELRGKYEQLENNHAIIVNGFNTVNVLIAQLNK